MPSVCATARAHTPASRRASRRPCPCLGRRTLSARCGALVAAGEDVRGREAIHFSAERPSRADLRPLRSRPRDGSLLDGSRRSPEPLEHGARLRYGYGPRPRSSSGLGGCDLSARPRRKTRRAPRAVRLEVARDEEKLHLRASPWTSRGFTSTFAFIRVVLGGQAVCGRRERLSPALRSVTVCLDRALFALCTPLTALFRRYDAGMRRRAVVSASAPCRRPVIVLARASMVDASDSL